MSKFGNWAVRHAVSSSGATRFAITSVRQSNDCSVVRSTTPALRISATARSTKVSGSTTVSPEVGVIFVSRSNRTFGSRAFANANSSASVGTRSPSRASCSGHCLPYEVDGFTRPTS